MTQQNLLIELLVEELPPKALHKLGDAFALGLKEQLEAHGLAQAQSVVTAYATPRRLAAHITQVAARASDRSLRQKLMPVSVGLNAQGQPTPALLKKLQALGVAAADIGATVAALQRAPDGKAEALFYDSVATGVELPGGLQKALDTALTKLPIPKAMQYQLHDACELPGWSSVAFIRPAHGLVALHGDRVLPIKVLGLTAGRQTRGHRFEAQSRVIDIAHADSYADTLLEQGAVLASFTERRAEIARQLTAQAKALGGGLVPVQDPDLLDEVTALVERPNVLACQFEQQFLELPPECLILTMKANQKYFPLLDAQGQLTRHFLVVSNIRPADPSAIIDGNQRVVRPRLADAKFFFDQDRKKKLKDRVAGLSRVVYHNQLGTQHERTERVCAIARALATEWPQRIPSLVEQVAAAAPLIKADLLTDMVGEFPELQGIMGSYYARHDGLEAAVAQAIEDHYRPRFSGDQLPRNPVGLVLALADKLETLVGMFGIGNLPTGDKDPYALRRHALGVIRIIIENNLPFQFDRLRKMAEEKFSKGVLIGDWRTQLEAFFLERLRGYLKDWGYTSHEIEAVVLGGENREWADLKVRLQAVRAFAALPEAAALAAANKRIGNILKKTPDSDQLLAAYDATLFSEPVEHQLDQAFKKVIRKIDGKFEARDFSGYLQEMSGLRDPIDQYFEKVMVNASDSQVRQNRLGMLKTLHQCMNRVADLSRLAT